MTKPFGKRSSWLRPQRNRGEASHWLVGVASVVGYGGGLIALATIVSLLLLLVFSGSAVAQEGGEGVGLSAGVELATSNELIERSEELDKSVVTFEGEAIGEALERGRNAWVNVSDGGNAIGVWMSRVEANSISRFGDYKNEGDFVRVVGEFNRACPEHGGDLDIHASSIVTLVAGTESPHPLSPAKAIVAGVATLIALAIFLLLRAPRNR